MNHPDTRHWDQGWCLIAADANPRKICHRPSSSPPFLLPSTSSPSQGVLTLSNLPLNVDSKQDAQADPLRILLPVRGRDVAELGTPTYACLATSGSPLFRVASIYLVRVFLSVYPTSRSLFNPGKGVGLGRQTLGCGVRLGYSGILSPAVISVWSWIFRFRTYKKE